MAFKPSTAQSYQLIAKHSKLALSVPHSPQWSQVEQNTVGKLNMRQQFRFDSGENCHWIMPAYKDHYLCINNASQDKNAEVICYHWEPKQHFMFEFLYAGEGYYRIRTLHSGMYFDIKDALPTEGAKLVQHPLMTTGNQLFRPVLVPGSSGVPATSFYEVNELTRTVVLGLIGLAPKVGGGLSFVVGYFWTAQDKQANLWQQMKEYVELRIDVKIMGERVKKLNSKLNGMIKVIRQIESSTENDRGTLLLTIIYSVTDEEDLLFDGSVQMLPYITGFGTLMVSLRRILLTEYADYYGHPATPQMAEANLKHLKDTIQEYRDAVTTGTSFALTNRKAHIKNRVTKRTNSHAEGYSSTYYESVIEDTYTGWRQTWSYSIMTNHGKTTHEGWSDHAERADYAVEQLRNQVEVQYTSTLDEFLLIADEWKYMEPGKVRPTGVTQQRTVGSYGGMVAGKNTLHAPATLKPITKIILHTNPQNVFCGLEIFYGGTSAGMAGKKGTEQTVDLSKDTIAGVYGVARDEIMSLCITTHSGVVTRAGNLQKPADEHFRADLSDGLDSYLVAITGTFNDQGVQQLSFKWEYKIKDPVVKPA